MAELHGPICPLCGTRACTEQPGVKNPPPFCPMLEETELLDHVARAYVEQEELRDLALASARTEAAGYGRATRIEETMDFARRIGATKLGIAHRVGLMQEARVAQDAVLGIEHRARRPVCGHATAVVRSRGQPQRICRVSRDQSLQPVQPVQP